MSDFDLGSIGDSLKQLQNAYSGGLDAMNQAGKQAAEEMNPSHRIIIESVIQANIEGHEYYVDSKLEYLTDLDSILNAETGDLSSVLDGLGVDLGDDKDAVMEQLGKPKCVGKLDQIKINKINLETADGKIKEGINKNSNILISLEGEELKISFESAFALPELQAKNTVYNVVPSQEKMQENVVVPKDNLEKKIKFNWVENDKDGLKITGDLEINKI